ncbi:SAV_6107 family HEPN domain-containing protein [Streptomyces sp. NPDC051207]|uniref:SAV_6107 family HEPN domain-containing protein n=1 Tax=Streptomyces sp. NPDC051207 TaxID=3154641 RepID=UPI0034212C6C
METAHGLDDSLRQYALTHHAALQAAAAVVTPEQRPEHRPGRRARIRGTWDLLPEVAPEHGSEGRGLCDCDCARSTPCRSGPWPRPSISSWSIRSAGCASAGGLGLPRPWPRGSLGLHLRMGRLSYPAEPPMRYGCARSPGTGLRVRPCRGPAHQAVTSAPLPGNRGAAASAGPECHTLTSVRVTTSLARSTVRGADSGELLAAMASGAGDVSAPVGYQQQPW